MKQEIKPLSMKGFQFVDAEGYPDESNIEIKEPVYNEVRYYPEFVGDDSNIHLLAETIKGALEDLLNKDPEIRKAAREWFKSSECSPPTKGEPVINFLWICDAFGLDADWLRRKLLEFAEERIRNGNSRRKINKGPAIRMLRQVLLSGKKQSSKQEAIHANR